MVSPMSLSVLLFLFILLQVQQQSCNGQKILFNAKFYTVDNGGTAGAIAVNEHGIIVAVGSYETIRNDYPEYTETDLDGQLVLPGFQDVHIHAVEAGINEQICYVDPTSAIADIPSWFDECANGGLFGDQGWIMGAGIDLEQISLELDTNNSADYPITVLDDRWPTTPVVILDQLGHGAIANTAAMIAVGYVSSDGTIVQKQQQYGGQILQDAETGIVTGIVTENAQQRLREAAFPPTTANQDIAYQSLLRALDELKRNGITSVSDAGGFWKQAQTDAWTRAEEEGVLTVRASNALYIYPDEDLVSQLPKLLERYSNDKEKLVRFNQAKIYVDGILSLSTGALYEPYTYDPFESYKSTASSDWYGFEYFGSASDLNTIAQTLVNDGNFQLHFHVTGDAGAGMALSAIESLNDSTSTGPHRLTHCYLVDDIDRARFQELNVVADFQLAPSSVSAEYKDIISEFIGGDRASQLLPAVELYDVGAMITLSSDWDADVLSPLQKIQTVLTRPDGRSFADVETVLPMLTINAATLLQQDDMNGSIEVGKYADLVVIDKDILAIPITDIASAVVTRTYLQGELIYRRGSGSLRPNAAIVYVSSLLLVFIPTIF